MNVRTKRIIKIKAGLQAGLALMLMLPQLGYGQVSGHSNDSTKDSKVMVKLLTLDPGHFHAALVQKSMYPVIDPEVYVYAPGGPELQAHLALIKQYNERSDHPTHWVEKVYEGPDYLEKMIAEKKGNVVVMAGNNRLKTHYIDRAVQAGFHVLSDKPMAIDEKGFELLVKAFSEAKNRHVLLYDIMTERSEITNILQKELMHLPEVFGALKKGSAQDPSVVMESVHFYYKNVSGKTLTRPDWFFDPTQQGEALADVGTHLIDLVQWICFPNSSVDYKKDIQVLSSSTWPTPISLSRFSTLTKKEAFPAFLRPYMKGDTLLEAHGNGEVTYRLKGVYAKVTALWEYQAPEGSGDRHHALLKGTKAQLEIRQGAAENYQPTLYIFPVAATAAYTAAVKDGIKKLSSRYPGITLQEAEGGWRVEIPEKYKVGHEAHFAQVMERYLQFLRTHQLPQWEEKGMLAKYYTSTKALQMAVEKDPGDHAAAQSKPNRLR
jgi:predicted dehydrogenase